LYAAFEGEVTPAEANIGTYYESCFKWQATIMYCLQYPPSGENIQHKQQPLLNVRT